MFPNFFEEMCSKFGHLSFEGKHHHDAAHYPVNWVGLGEVSGHSCAVFWLVDNFRYLRNHFLEERLLVNPMDRGAADNCKLFLFLVRDKELPDQGIVGVFINPRGDSLTD